MNWIELKEFCNSLNEDQLSKKVILWREDEAITDIETLKLEVDHYIDEEEGNGMCFPISEWEGQIDDSALRKVYDKGTPLLVENF